MHTRSKGSIALGLAIATVLLGVYLIGGRQSVQNGSTNVISPTSSKQKTISFGSTAGTPSSYTEDGLIVKANSGGHLHLQDSNSDGSIDLMNHGGSSSPYQFRLTSGALFTVESFDVVRVQFGVTAKFLAFKSAEDVIIEIITVTKTGKVTLGTSNWTNIQSFNWSVTSAGSGTQAAIDNLVVFLGTKPTISSLSPSSTVAGGGPFDLTVTGNHFQDGAVVRWNGSSRTTTFVNSTTLVARITDSDIATAGTADISVRNPDLGASQSVTFTINNPLPKISSLSPSSATAGGTGFTLTVSRTETHDGTAFVPTSVVRWNGSDRPTTFVNNTQLTASITAADIATAGTATVTVFNPAPGGGTSNEAIFTINNPVPEITSLSPNSATAGGQGFTLTVSGSRFVTASKVNWNGSERQTTFLSSSQLQAAIPASDISAAATALVTVVNPAPGGGASNAVQFTIAAELVPRIDTLNPSSVTAGSSSFTVAINGANFESAHVVQWNGTDQSTTFVNSTQLTITVTAEMVALAGTAVLTVRHPISGAISNSALFTINNPTPQISSLDPLSATAGETGFQLTINGTGFVPSSLVTWNGSARTATFVSSTRLTVSIATTDVATSGTVTVAVINPEPGGGTATASFTVNSPVPSITQITPSTATVGGSAFTLTVNGSGFLTNSKVKWNGSERTTTFIGSTQLTALIPASDISSAGTAIITVENPTPGGGVSNPATFTIGNPAPKLLSLSPASAPAAAATFTLTVNGSDFVAGSTVKWNGSNRSTTFQNSTRLLAAIPASDLTASGTASVTVVTPSPGGGTSNALPFTIAAQFLYFPLLVSDSAVFTGFALANSSDSTIDPTFEAFTNDGDPLETLIPPGSLSPKHQIAKLTQELFPDTTAGWFRVSLPGSAGSLKGFFLHGRSDLSTIDGVEASDQLSTDLIFSLVGKSGAGESQIILVNPNSTDATLRVELFGPSGSTGLIKQNTPLAKRSRMEKTISQLFDDANISALYPNDAASGQLYLRVQSDIGLFGVHTFAERTSTTDFVALRGQDANSEAGEKLYFAHAAEGEGYETLVSLVNLKSGTANVSITLVLDDGTRQTVSRPIQPSAIFRFKLAELFSIINTNRIQVGYVEASSDGQLLGNVTFRHRLKGATAALPGQKTPSPLLTFSHVAVQDVALTSNGWLTGVALLNPTSNTATIKITVRKTDGTVAGVRENLTLGPGKRLSRLLAELVREVKNQAGGYIVVESTQPLFGFELFGDWQLNKLAAVPAQ